MGQLKLFSHNTPVYQTVAEYLKTIWTEKAQAIFKGRPEVDLHLQMISTVPSAEEVYQDTAGNYGHLDELWFWIPQTQRAIDHLVTFLYAFQYVPEIEANAVEVMIEGAQAVRYQEIFKQNFLNLPLIIREESTRETTLAILRYKAGSLNSRKALISPYLPKLLT